jgi:hypothetical protein
VLEKYLADGPYRFSMAFQRGTFADFYKPSSTDPAILRERRHWLATDPAKYLQVESGSEELLSEAWEMGVEQGTLPAETEMFPDRSALARFLGEHWEPDYLILKREPSAIRLLCGCVCFPSSWALEEKIGQRIEEIHGVVPDLNADIGRQIGTFLQRLKPGVAWLRSNWGLSRSPELNQHPSRRTPRLDEFASLDEVYFRVEEQSLVALPKSDGILFGIKLRIFPLRNYASTEAARRLAAALESMPEKMAQYKGLSSTRRRLIELLSR